MLNESIQYSYCTPIAMQPYLSSRWKDFSFIPDCSEIESPCCVRNPRFPSLFRLTAPSEGWNMMELLNLLNGLESSSDS